VDYIVLLAGALIEPVESLFKLADFAGDSIAFRQLDVDVFFNISVKKRVINV
jgi:hypothetical protein